MPTRHDRLAIALACFALVLSLFSATGIAGQSAPVATPEPEILIPEADSGSYIFTADGPQGAFSGGMELIGPFDDGVYVVTWTQAPERGRGPGYQLSNAFGAGFGGSTCGAGMYALQGDIEADPLGIALEGIQFTADNRIIAQIASSPQAIDGGVILDLTSDSTAQPTGSLQLIDSGDRVRVTLTEGDSIQQGVGFVFENTLLVAFGAAPTCGVLGLSSADSGATYAGQWTTLGATALYAEAGAIFSVTGSYAVRGINPDRDSEYSGALMIGSDGQVHTFTWTLGTETVTGAGIRRGSLLSTSYGGPTCGSGIFVQTNFLRLESYFALPGSPINGYILTDLSATPVERGGDLSGVYPIDEYRSVDDSVVTGTLTISALGVDDGARLYTLEFRLSDGQIVYGTGIQYGTELIYGFDTSGATSSSCGVTGFVAAPDRLDGQWITHGAALIGQEFATRGN